MSSLGFDGYPHQICLPKRLDIFSVEGRGEGEGEGDVSAIHTVNLPAVSLSLLCLMLSKKKPYPIS
jgi:hypothetical protein